MTDGELPPQSGTTGHAVSVAGAAAAAEPPESLLASVALESSLSFGGGDTVAIPWDTIESDDNMVDGVPTAPDDGLYWVNASIYVSSNGGGFVTLTVYGSSSGALDRAVIGGDSLAAATLACVKRVHLQAGEGLSAALSADAGADGWIFGGRASNYLQLWQ